jgi:hypothetical protein
MSDTTTSSIAWDHLYAGEQPVNKQTGTVTVAQSQTLTRGAAMGVITLGAVTAVADGGNTGDGTCTVLSTLPGNPVAVVGDYNLECVTAVTNGGVFKLEDPNGKLITNTLTMTVGAGAATALEAGGLAFTLTDGATDFAAGDKFAVTVAAGSGQAVLLDKDATDGSSEIYGILTEDVTTAAAATQVAPVDLTGLFNTGVVTFASGTAYTDIEDDARLKSIYFRGTNY